MDKVLCTAMAIKRSFPPTPPLFSLCRQISSHLEKKNMKIYEKRTVGIGDSWVFRGPNSGSSGAFFDFFFGFVFERNELFSWIK